MNANAIFAAAVVPVRSSEVPRSVTIGTGPGSGSVGALENLDCYRVSIEACRVAFVISRSLNSNLRDQILRASSSVVLNVAEGFGSRSRGIKRRHYEIAGGSAAECIAICDLAVAMGCDVDAASVLSARALFGRCAAMLKRLAARFR